MKCFFCTAPYQILACTSIAIRDNEPGDLFILDQFNDYKRIGEKVEKRTDLFSHVYYLNENDIINSLKQDNTVLSIHLKLLKLYSGSKNVVQHISQNPEKYTDIYLSSKAILPRIFSFYCKKKYNSVVHYFDDGIGSYDNTAYETKILEKIVRTTFFGLNSLNIEETKELYLPKLYYNLHPNSHERIVGIPCVSVEIIRELYDTSIINPISERIVYFDTVYNEEYGKNTEAYKAMISDAFSEIKDGLIIKPHPREKRRLLNFKTYEENQLPFECNCAIQTMNNKILISTFSTACVVPKMLFDIEPIVIFLYKIFQGIRVNNSSLDESFCTAFRNTYKDKSRVLIPNSIEELKSLLSLLLCGDIN